MAGYGYNNPLQAPPATSGGNWVWDAAKGVWNFLKGNAGDILGTAGTVAGEVMSSADRAKALAEQKAEYEANLKQRQAEAAQSHGEYQSTLEKQKADSAQSAEQYGRTTGDTEAQAAVRAKTQLNKAPIADKAQALVLARMGVAPGAFQPRDYTQGTANLSKSFTAPGADVATAMQHASQGYKPGQGGVDTSVIKALLAKLTGSSGLMPSTGQPIVNGPPPLIKPKTPIVPGIQPPPVTTAPTSSPTLPPRLPFRVPQMPVTPRTPAPAVPPSDESTDPNDPTAILTRRLVPSY